MSLSWEVVSIVQHNQHKYSHSAFVSRTQRATGHRLQPTDIYIFVELGLTLCGTNAVMTFSSVPKKKNSNIYCEPKHWAKYVFDSTCGEHVTF